MSYFSSLLRQTGVPTAVSTGVREHQVLAGDVPIEVHESRFATEPPVLGPESTEVRNIPAAIVTPAAPKIPPSPTRAHRPDTVGSQLTAQQTVIEHRTLILAQPSTVAEPPEVTDAVFARSEQVSIENAPAVPYIVIEERAGANRPRRPDTEPPWSAPVHSPAKPVTFEEVRRWVAAPLVDRQNHEVEPVVEIEAAAVFVPAKRNAPRSRIDHDNAELQTENYTVSIGAIQVIVEDPTPRPAEPAPSAQVRDSSPTSSALDSTRLSRHYITF